MGISDAKGAGQEPSAKSSSLLVPDLEVTAAFSVDANNW